MKPGYVPRAHRPQRALALAAFNRFLERHPDLRIGQAIFALAVGVDPFNLEDGEILEACEADGRRQAKPCATCGKPGHLPMNHGGWDPRDEGHG